ncbi:MAG TPA: hypothetical protein VEC99_00505 [Clostridia bacterium]|nr:hypothetical protein [Clostridia bacterium]
MKKRILLLIGVLLVAMAILYLLANHSQSHRALLQYKTELRAQGERLTLDELTSPRTISTNDSHGTLVAAVAAMRSQPLSPASLELRKFTVPGKALVSWQQKSPVWHWKASQKGTWEDFAAQMPALEPSLQKLREAMKDPSPNEGPMTSIWGKRVDFVAIRSAAQWLMGATLCELHQGKLEAALQNLEALASLTQMEREEYTLVSQMIRVAVAGLGIATTWEALQAPGWTEPQLSRLQKCWESMDLISALETGFQGDRAVGEEIWREVRQGKSTGLSAALGMGSSGRKSFEDAFSSYVVLPAYRMTSINEDELLHLQTMQEILTACRQLNTNRPWPAVRLELDKTSGKIKAINNPLQRFKYMLSRFSMTSLVRVGSTVMRNETERRLTITVIALKRYQLHHGTWPPTLEAMVPEFLSQVLLDPMSGKALCYRLQPENEFLLYSVGEDGVNDQGNPNPPPSKSAGMWEAPDAVWPSADRL